MKHKNIAAAAISAVLGLMSLALSAKESYIGSDSTVVVRDYIANMEYVNGVLERVNFAGGYIDMTGDSPRYMYYETDHLGNVRAVVDEDGHVCQTNNYYPYGDRFAGSASGNQYLFGGKEYSSDTGLHDFEARYADTRFGRFTTMDPMAEKYYSVSPYAYCAGNPVNFVDPDGMDTYMITNYGMIDYTIDDSPNSLFIGENQMHLNNGQSDLLRDLFFNQQKNGFGTASVGISFFSNGLNSNNALFLFKFICDNTEVEWSLYSIGKGNEGYYQLDETNKHCLINSPIGYYKNKDSSKL